MIGHSLACDSLAGDFKTQPAVPFESGRLSLFRTIESARTGQNCRSTGGWVFKPSFDALGS